MSILSKLIHVASYFHFIIIFLVILSPVLSQEQQIEFAPQVEVIDRDMANEVGIFQEYAGFKEARLFLKPDSSWVLEIYTAKDGQTIRNREPISEEELADLQQQIRSKITEKPSLVGLNQRGRPHLIAGSIPLGIYYGASLGEVVSDDVGNAAGALPLLVGGGLTLTTILTTRDKEVTHAMGSMALNGGLMGIAHGGMLLGALEDDGWEGETFLGISTVFSIGEGMAYYSVAKNNDFSPGRGAMWNFGNFWGAAYGMGLTALISDFDRNPQWTLAGGLAGSGLGIWASQALYKKHPQTAGNVSGVSNLSTLGTLLGSTVFSATDPGHENAALGYLLGGTAIGTASGFVLMKNRRFDATDGLYMTLGNIGGMLVGGGFSILTGAGGSGSLLLITAGGLGGVLSVYSMLKNEESKPNRIGLFKDQSPGNLSINVNPFSLFGNDQPTSTLMTLSDIRTNSTVHLQFTF